MDYLPKSPIELEIAAESERRDHFALEFTHSYLLGPWAFLNDNPKELARKAVEGWAEDR